MSSPRSQQLRWSPHIVLDSGFRPGDRAANDPLPRPQRQRCVAQLPSRTPYCFAGHPGLRVAQRDLSAIRHGADLYARGHRCVHSVAPGGVRCAAVGDARPGSVGAAASVFSASHDRCTDRPPPFPIFGDMPMPRLLTADSLRSRSVGPDDIVMT